jgi:hypothetical protein
MQNSYRISTEIGKDKIVNFQLDQSIEFLEILSFKVRQFEIYTLDCANYGVVVGRVTANGGFGLPNARVSIFIPLTDEDSENPLISSKYPYKAITDRNEEGYRYNLLPKDPSYPSHVATGTFPSLNDVIVDAQEIEVFEKYYKYTVQTNSSGDYMIFGVPTGSYNIIMDLDLSDIGDYSLTPQDLIRMGRATEAQFKGNSFQKSSDLNSLPQIVSITKGIDISPLWGNPETCDSSINRVDFDLRADSNIDIQPTAIFIGSIFGTSNTDSIKLNCGVKENLGNLCQLEAGPGQILAIRQTKNLDENNRPILEVYELDNNGRVIDGDGAWVVELPMNLNYTITDENGNRVITDDATIGIPTKGKYRFKVKWQDSDNSTSTTRKAHFLVPNIKEYGWDINGNIDPSSSTNATNRKALSSSYYFGLDWDGYANYESAVNCEDTFYEFDFNKVYTVASLVDQYQGGTNKGKFIGIKEIGDRSCEQNVNKYPVNDGVKNFDLLYYLFSIILQIFQFINIPLIFGYHLIAFLWNFFAVIIYPAIIGIASYLLAKQILDFVKWLASAAYSLANFNPLSPAYSAFLFSQVVKDLASIAVLTTLNILLITNFRKLIKKKIKLIHLPNITYPNCEFCDCEMKETDVDVGESNLNNGALTQLSNSSLYYNNLSETFNWTKLKSIIVKATDQSYVDDTKYEDDKTLIMFLMAQAIAGRSSNSAKISAKRVGETDIKMPRSDEYTLQTIKNKKFSVYNEALPIGERINYFNLRQNYFTGKNKIKVSFANEIVGNKNKFHYDNVIVVISDVLLETGDLISFVNNKLSNDPNYKYTGTTSTGEVYFGVPGVNKVTEQNKDIVVKYAITQDSENSTTYTLPITTNNTNTSYYASDIEYFQVITGITYNDYIKMSNNTNKGYLPSVLTSPAVIRVKLGNQSVAGDELILDNPIQYFQNIESSYVLIIQRGVDPYSPEFSNKYSLGKIFGNDNEDAVIITTNTKLNIPIQKLNDYNGNIRILGKGGNASEFITTQTLTNQEDIFFESYSFQPGVEFKSYQSDSVSYYSGMLGRNSPITKPFIIKLGIIPTLIKYIKNWVKAQPNDPDNNFFIVNGERAGGRSQYPNKTPIQWIDSKYGDSNLDFNGGSYMVGKGDIVADNRYDINPFEFDNFMLYYSYSSHLELKNRKLSHSNRNKIVLRNDRLPTSDGLDGKSWLSNGVGILQQNNAFTIYKYPKNSTGEGSPLYGDLIFDADIITDDFNGLARYDNVSSTFNQCNQLVPLSCYVNKDNSETISINESCLEDKRQSIYIEDGCYQLVRRPILDLLPDIRAYREWIFRFKLNYALCRGIVSETFSNNWVNGSLFMPSFKANVFGVNKNNPQYCKDIIYYDNLTNNFYYRSSPYFSSANNSKFVGNRSATPSSSANKLNRYNLMTPTTIVNLGVKNQLLTSGGDFDNYSYVVNNINNTSYADNSDLLNTFVISRIIDSELIKNITSTNRIINSFFSRGGRKIDGDLAQLLSINSEFGVVKFSSEFYTFTTNNSPSIIFRENNKNYMGVFYSSTQDELTLKDYITPGRIGFREQGTNAIIPKYFKINDQEVPFYSWTLDEKGQTIFGTDKNEWGTNQNNFITKKYQSLERITPEPNNSVINPEYVGTDYFSNRYYNKTYNTHRGYIYSETNGLYDKKGSADKSFLVGAPFHFYFGIKKGFSALDKFKTKYLNE